MASIRNRNGRWQVRINRKGYPSTTKTFNSRSLAERWAKLIENEVENGNYQNANQARLIKFKDAIERYIQEVTYKSKSFREDGYRLRATMCHWIGSLAMSELTQSKIIQYRDERLSKVSAGTVIRELAYISSIINHARREWGYEITNPIPLVKKPTSPPGRNRILTEDELNRLFQACVPKVKNGNHLILPIIKFALETAMRRSEILSLTWGVINFEKRTAYLPNTKNGTSRIVPLSLKAIEILKSLPENSNSKVFQINAPNLSAHFEKVRAIAKIEDIHFHDLRHMAITRMSKKLPNLIELSFVSGHKSLKMLQRYYHPDATELALKLD
jgi:integrase